MGSKFFKSSEHGLVRKIACHTVELDVAALGLAEGFNVAVLVLSFTHTQLL